MKYKLRMYIVSTFKLNEMIPRTPSAVGQRLLRY